MPTRTSQLSPTPRQQGMVFERHSPGRFVVAIAFCVVFSGLASSPALAQEGFGFHGGYTVDPDQGYFGMHFITKPLGGNLRLHPSGDVGFGDGLTLASLHLDFAQWFDIGRTWRIYFGGGPAVNFYRFDYQGYGGEATETEVEGGFDTVVGFATRGGFMFEMRVGASGSPDLRFGVGFTFH